MPATTKRRVQPDRASEESAKAAGLVYVCADTPGIRRMRSGKGFKYVDARGRVITDKMTLGRIRRLAIPPAWREVWICPKAEGHLQAVGYDARGRKQYRYHPRWREVRDENKYTNMLAFAKALPRIRRKFEEHLRLPGLSREKVLATVVKILEKGFIRVGNDEYARTNNSYGLTTLRDRHVAVNGSTIRFQFRGKAGKYHKIDLEDRRLAKIIANCQAIAGQELFQYIDDEGKPRDITSTDVNEYLKEISGGDFTAKDFRTWAGTVQAAAALSQCGACGTRKEAKQRLKQAIEAVAQQLGNTPAICRKCYVHPFVIQAWLDGSMNGAFKKARVDGESGRSALKPEESSLLEFLRKRWNAGRKEQRSTLIEKLEASLKHRKK
jgi:DNA topoisomerase-1